MIRIEQKATLAATLGLFIAACGGGQTGPTPDPVDGAVTDNNTTDTRVQRPRELTPEERAELTLQEAAEAFSTAIELYASADTGSRDTARIEELMTEAMAKNPEYTTEAWFNVGLMRFEAGDVPGALAAYEQATASDPDYARGMANVGYIQMTQGDYQTAAQTFQACITRREIEPGCNINLAILYGMGELPAPGGDVDSAQVERLRFALGGDARSADAFALLATNYYEAGQLALARLVCENAILLGIDEAVLHNRLGLIALEEGNVIEALAEFRRTVELAPSMTSAWVNIGAMSLSFRDYDSALNAFEIVLEERPDDRDVRLSYGAALRGVEEPERAQAEYEAILAAVPTHPGALFNMALLYQEAYQDYPEACGYYFQFLDSAPTDHDRFEDANRRVNSLHELLGSLLFLEQATEEQVAACAR